MSKLIDTCYYKALCLDFFFGGGGVLKKICFMYPNYDFQYGLEPEMQFISTKYNVVALKNKDFCPVLKKPCFMYPNYDFQ